MSVVFKSPLNALREVEVRLVSSLQIDIAANSSLRTEVAFPKPLSRPPLVLYSLTCPDEEFNLHHYLGAVSAEGFVILVENLSALPRKLTVVYQVLNF